MKPEYIEREAYLENFQKSLGDSERKLGSIGDSSQSYSKCRGLKYPVRAASL